MKIYISGKMGRPIDEEIRSKFFKAYFALMEKHGLTPNDIVNPASDYYQAKLKGTLYYGRDNAELRGMDFDEYYETLLFDMGKIHTCDAIYMLKDWTASPGARAEHEFAKAIGLEVMYEEEYIDVPCKQLLDEMIEMSESMNAGRSFVKYDHRGWDVIVTVKRQKKKGNDEEANPQGEA